MIRTRSWAALAGAAVLALAAAPAFAQDEAGMDMEGATIEVGGVEYAYTDLPTSVPVGTTLTLANHGVEVHEIALIRLDDSLGDASIGDLEAMYAEGRDLMAEGLIEFVGFTLALPGETSAEGILLEREGRYLANCNIQQGSDPAILEKYGLTPEDIGPDVDPSTLPEEVQDVLDNPSHSEAGMVQEFIVTAEDTEVGPLPEVKS